MALLEVNNLKKVYTTRFAGNQVEALKNINFSVEEGEYIAIMGESGSGKTTLLNVIAMLDGKTSGEILLLNEDITKISASKVSKFRRENLGFIFQDFNLLDTLSGKENMMLPLVLSKKPVIEIDEKVRLVAKKLEIEYLLLKYPYEMSGGEKQRIAIARAIITNPKLILADEPTGALDSNTADRLMDIFSQLNAKGQTVIMVSHSIKASSRANRILFIKDGSIFHQIYRGNLSDDQMFEKISDSLKMLERGEQL